MWKKSQRVQWLLNNGKASKAQVMESRQIYLWDLCLYLHSIFFHLLCLLHSLLSKHLDFHCAGKNNSNNNGGDHTVNLRGFITLSSLESHHLDHSIYEYSFSRQSVWFSFLIPDRCSDNHDLESLCAPTTEYYHREDSLKNSRNSKILCSLNKWRWWIN